MQLKLLRLRLSDYGRVCGHVYMHQPDKSLERRPPEFVMAM